MSLWKPPAPWDRYLDTWQGIQVSVWALGVFLDSKNYVSSSCWEDLGIELLFQHCDEMTWVIPWHRKPVGLGSCMTCQATHWPEKVHPICPDLPYRVLRACPHAKKSDTCRPEDDISCRRSCNGDMGIFPSFTLRLQIIFPLHKHSLFFFLPFTFQNFMPTFI